MWGCREEQQTLGKAGQTSQGVVIDICPAPRAAKDCCASIVVVWCSHIETLEKLLHPACRAVRHPHRRLTHGIVNKTKTGFWNTAMLQVALIQNTNTDLAVTPPEAAAPEPVSPLSESKSDAAPIHTSSISLWASNFNRACVRACVRTGAEADALLFAY